MHKKGHLIIISGPSGAGKGSICSLLKERCDDLKISVSETTRAPRAHEVAGESYHFVDRETFENGIREGEYLEYACNFGHYYGTPKSFTLEQLEAGKDVLLEIDIKGAAQVKERFPEGTFIFILPPSLAVLKDRIHKRGTETEAQIKERMNTAATEMEQIVRYSYFVINEELEQAAKQVISIIQAERCKVDADIDIVMNKFRREQDVKTSD